MDNKQAIEKIERSLSIPSFRRISQDEGNGGTSLKGYITTTFGALEKAFGVPDQCDGYKVSGQWRFHDLDGNEYTIYDWKCTDLYDSELPTVSELRNSKTPMEFNIGGDKGDTAAFIAALEQAIPGAKGRASRW